MGSGEGYTLTGAEQTRAFQYIRVAHALALEINTGLKVARGGSVMVLAAGYCGSTKRTKKGVLRDYLAWMPTVVANYEPTPLMVKALGGK